MATEIRYHPRLYVGDGITEKKLEKIKKRLANDPLRSGVSVIALSRNGVDQLDIFDGKMLAWPYYRENPPLIVGLTRSREESIQMVERMVRECWKARGDCSLREYLLC